MLKTIKKRGRPQASYRISATGERVHGLLRRADGRWKISATGQTFVEPDEMLAVARFRQWHAEHAGTMLGKLEVHATAELAMIDILRRTQAAGGSLSTAVKPAGDGKGAWAVVDHTLSPEQWIWLRSQILERPIWVGEQVGIEQIGYIRDLKRPAASARLSALIDTYTGKPNLSANEASRSILFWKQFARAVEVDHIGDVEHHQVVEYERVVLAAGLAPKSIHHRFSKVKTIVGYALKRGIDIHGCRTALDALAMLEVKDAHPIDPTPISVPEFWAVHNAAERAGDTTFATLMLTALNCCAYGGEVASLRWSELDLKAGTYVGRRPKTKVSRVAVLWPEVVAGLKRVPVRSEVDYVFNTSRRSFTSNAVLKYWRRYREAAKLDEAVTFGRIRDAAYSIACQHASLDQAKVLAGHAFGGASDFYVRRNPQFVSDACQAIRNEFFARRRRKAQA